MPEDLGRLSPAELQTLRSLAADELACRARAGEPVAPAVRLLDQVDDRLGRVADAPPPSLQRRQVIAAGARQPSDRRMRARARARMAQQRATKRDGQ